MRYAFVSYSPKVDARVNSILLQLTLMLLFIGNMKVAMSSRRFYLFRLHRSLGYSMLIVSSTSNLYFLWLTIFPICIIMSREFTISECSKVDVVRQSSFFQKASS